MFAEYVSLLRNINDVQLRQQSKEAFTLMRSMLEFIDSAQTT